VRTAGGVPTAEPPVRLRRTAIVLKTLKDLGLTADMMYLLGFLSVIGSIFVWYSQGGSQNGEEKASGERFGIFVGLWAPTFFAIGNGISQTHE
jgi:hypothetical protein